MDKNKILPETIDAYIAQFPPDIQEILTAVRKVIREAAPEAKEKISYQMPTFYLHGNLVHFAAQSKHLGFYPTPSGIKAFEQQLSNYKWAKGSVQFPYNQPIPYDLIRDITMFRVAENMAKVEAKSNKKRKATNEMD